MAKRTVDIVIKARDKASRQFGKVGGAAKGMSSMLKTAGVAAMAYFSARAIKDFVGSSLEAFGKQEAATKSLSDALTLLGQNSDAAMADMKAFAAEIQKQTVIGDEAVLEMMAMGSALGKLSGEGLKDATTAAIGLSRRLSIDTTAAMRLVARAAVGDTAQLKRYGVVLEEGLTPQQKFNQLLKIGADSFALAAGETDTYTGRMKQLGNVWGDVKEKLGKALLPMIEKVVEALKNAMPTIESWVTSFADGLGLLADLVKWFAKGFITAYTAVEVAIINWRDVLDLSWKSAKLGMITFVRDLKHFFTVAIPEYLRWFADNWKEIFQTIWNGMKTFATNVWKNMKNLFNSIKGLFKGEGWDFEWTGLLDGFENTIKEMPKVMARQLGADEIELKNQIGDIAEKLGNEFQRKLAPRLKLLEGGDGTPGDSGAKTATKKAAAAILATVQAGGGADAGAGVAGGGPKSLAAVESRFLTRAPGHYDPFKDLRKDNRRLIKNTERTAKATETSATAAAAAAVSAAAKLVVVKF